MLFAGPVYRSPEADRTAKFWVAVIVAVSLVDLLIEAGRLLRQRATGPIAPPLGAI